MEPNGPVRVHLVPFVHSQSYITLSSHLIPNYYLAGDPLELPLRTMGLNDRAYVFKAHSHWARYIYRCIHINYVRNIVV